MRFIHYLPPILLGLAVNVSAQVFEASGVGDTPEAAKKDAINNAIRFGAGEFVLSKEELNNDDFSQKIISHSNAYIKQIEVKSQVKLPNGSYEAQVAVDLENQALLKSLKEMKVAVAEDVVDNEALLQALNHFDKNDTVKNKEKNLKELIYEVFIKPIVENKEIYRVEILGKLKPLNPEPNRDEFPFELEYQITPMYVESLKRVLAEIETKENETGETVFYIPVVDLKNLEKRNPSRKVVLKDSTRDLFSFISNYELTYIEFDFIDKDEIIFENRYVRVHNNLQKLGVLSGSYRGKLNFTLKKDEVLRLKDIRANLNFNKIGLINYFK